MADVKLGTGSMVTLPPPTWPDGPNGPALAAITTRNVKTTLCADGSVRVDIAKQHKRTWNLDWDGIVYADAATIATQGNSICVLNFQNTWVDTTIYTVVVTEFEMNLKSETAARTARYIVHLKLMEV